jgi:regulator of protease activity HflC (stomatin/prohibitin superfamily)
MNITTIFGGLATIGWVLVIAVLALVVSRAAREKPVRNGGLFVLGLLIFAIAMSGVSAGIVFIAPEERGVVISAVSPTGYREQVLTPGLQFVIPGLETVVRYPISRQTYTMSIAVSEGAIQGDDSISARTADGQEIYIDASVIFAIDPNQVVRVHIYWKDRYTDSLIRPQARGVIRDVVSQYGVQEVVSTKRLEMVDQARTALAKKLEENGLVMLDFVLRNITFSKEYAASVEQKQISEQQAQQAKLIVEQKKQEAEQARQVAQGTADAIVIRAKADAESRLISAEAEAKSLELIAKALKDRPELLSYQYINRLAPNTQVMLLPSSSPFLFNMPGLNTVPVATPTVTPKP